MHEWYKQQTKYWLQASSHYASNVESQMGAIAFANREECLELAAEYAIKAYSYNSAFVNN